MSDCTECDGNGNIWNNADPTSGQRFDCEACQGVLAGITPLPWQLGRRTETLIDAADERSICSTGGYANNQDEKWVTENPANARYIVTAANAFPDLVAALECFVDQVQVGDGSKPVMRSKRVNCPASVLFAAKAALAKAKAQS